MQKSVSMMLKSVALVVAFCLFITPAMAQAQVFGDAVFDAERQAKSDVSSILWIAGGCLIGPIAVAVGYLVPLTHAPSAALMGKSPQYVQAYTSAYEKKVKSKQGVNALIGCALSSVWWIIYVVLIAAETATTDYYYY